MDSFRKQQEILARELPKTRTDAGSQPRGPHGILPVVDSLSALVRRCILELKEIDERQQKNEDTHADYQTVLEVVNALGIEV